VEIDAPLEEPLLQDTEGTPGNPLQFVLLLVIAVLGVNLPALTLAWNDRSWGALAISMAFGPALNASLAIGSSVLAIRWRRRYPGTWVWILVASWCVPAMVAVLDYFLISSMGLHGC
jgi:hypothetical protein